MCGMCPGVYGGCGEPGCRIAEPRMPDGTPRMFWMRWFELGEKPCSHVQDKHPAPCPARTGSGYCECNDNEEDE